MPEKRRKISLKRQKSKFTKKINSQVPFHLFDSYWKLGQKNTQKLPKQRIISQNVTNKTVFEKRGGPDDYAIGHLDYLRNSVLL